MNSYDLEDASVVVVIGSGAGGGTLANALARGGVDVVCLEAGSRLAPSEVVNDEAEMFAKLTWLDERIGTGVNIPNLPVWTCKTVGGTTMHWTAAGLRLQAHEFAPLSSYGAIDGANLVDWPLDLEELAPYYDAAEQRMGVTGTHGIPRLPGHNNYLVMEAGARRAGYRLIDTNNVAINSAPRDGRPMCLQLGFCTSGCIIHAKWSTAYTEITEAEATGHFELRPECMAVRLDHDEAGRVSGVRYRDRDGRVLTQRARAVCVAGNAVETTRLLLNSRSARYPGGLANSSGQLGRNYMRHLLGTILAIMPGPVNMHRGAQIAGVVRDEAGHDPARGFAGGFLFMTLPLTPESLARSMMPGAWGRRVTRVIERYDHIAQIMFFGEDLPLASNRISLHPQRRDQYGLPVPVVHYDHHPNSRALQEYAAARGRRIFEALGAEEIHEMIDVFPATHNMGTARMGTDPKRSVCDRWGRTHDHGNLFISDGSLFPSAGCENPTLTIIALALRQAEYLQGQLQRGAI